jgi:hypothetical protein
MYGVMGYVFAQTTPGRLLMALPSDKASLS